MQNNSKNNNNKQIILNNNMIMQMKIMIIFKSIYNMYICLLTCICVQNNNFPHVKIKKG